MPVGKSKTARARARETEKADKALGGAQLVSSVDVSADTEPIKPHYHAELQWFRLLRGQSRLNEIAKIFADLAPASVFDPKHIYQEQLQEQQVISNNLAGERNDENDDKKVKNSKKEKEKEPKLSKKDTIIAANKAKQQKAAVARDAEKLKFLGENAQSSIKLNTESGKFMLLNTILKKAVKEKDAVDALDTLWEIEEVAKEVSPEEAKAAIKENAKYIAAANEMRENIKDYVKSSSAENDAKFQNKPKNLVEYQLTYMSDRLPPLNLHSLKGKFKLDPWQMKVLQLIDNGKSVLITAPTSCGKTVLSTYVCGKKDSTTLFVVPTEPLAWQVAAMLRALKLEVSLVVPTLTLVPTSFSVVVGTPAALEATLTKQVGFDFDYAVYDEVHSLNTAEGDALQRIIKLMPISCRILALSATVGNAGDMLKWWQSLADKPETVELVQHKARFINLQRHIWTYQPQNLSVSTLATELIDRKPVGKLEHLHPCLSLSVDYLGSELFDHNDLAFTPVDTFNLFKSLETFTDESNPIHANIMKGLKPRKFFSDQAGDDRIRITLVQAKSYEDALKAALQNLARDDKSTCQRVLASLAPGSSIDEVKSLQRDQVESFLNEHVRRVVTASQLSASSESLIALVLGLKRDNVLPAILFQLDSVLCQSYFDNLLVKLEELERIVHPTYYSDLEAKEKIRLKSAEQAAKSKSGKKQDEDDEDALAAAQEEAAFGGDVALDTTAPHPDFNLSPVGKGIGPTEEKSLEETLSFDLPKKGDLPHPLIRGLRRGIGLYISGMPASYHRVVQSYAQSGRLGLVLSDELLAYGVNMPFRTAVFFGDPGSHWLTPLIHQQMAGRAGRRGLDRQGHLVYCGFGVNRLQQLLRGELPDIIGKFPLYPTVPLQLYMNRIYDNVGEPLDEFRMQKMCSPPLAQFIGKESNNNLVIESGKEYFETAQKWVEYLGINNHPVSSYKDLVPELVWDLREYLAESLTIEYILEELIDHFRHVPVQQSDTDVKEQEKICLIFALICSRKKAFYYLKEHSSDDDLQGTVLERLYSIQELDDGCVRFLGDLGEKEADQEDWKRWKGLVADSQARIQNLDLKYKFHMLLPADPTNSFVALDNSCYASFQRNQIDPKLPTPVQHELRGRLWHLGEVLRICFNVLGRSKELAGLTNLIRKSFVRIRYILDETSERNWNKLS